MIVAHHAGEELILLLAASGASTVPVLLVVWRARLGGLVDRIRRR